MASSEELPEPKLEVSGDTVGRLRECLAHTGKARLAPALPASFAEAMRVELTKADGWARSMRQGKIERQLDAAELARLTPAQVAGLEAFARQGDETVFRFLHDAIRINEDAQVRAGRGMLIDRFADELNSARTLDLVGELVGEPVKRWGGDATRYLPGHFLTTHNDGRKHGKRVLAIVLNLSDWHIDWGGLTLFHDAEGGVEETWVPRFNTLNMFTIPRDHSVTWVTPLARWPRLAIAGWFYAD